MKFGLTMVEKSSFRDLLMLVYFRVENFSYFLWAFYVTIRSSQVMISCGCHYQITWTCHWKTVSWFICHVSLLQLLFWLMLNSVSYRTKTLGSGFMSSMWLSSCSFRFFGHRIGLSCLLFISSRSNSDSRMGQLRQYLSVCRWFYT